MGFYQFLDGFLCNTFQGSKFILLSRYKGMMKFILLSYKCVLQNSTPCYSKERGLFVVVVVVDSGVLSLNVHCNLAMLSAAQGFPTIILF